MAAPPSKRVGVKDPSVSYQDRQAVRVIVQNSRNEIILIHIAKGSYFKLPGGGVDPGEPHSLAAEREVMEETGCKVHIDGECFSTVEEWRNDLHQISYCYRANLIEDTGKPELTDLETSEGLKHEWIDVDGSLEKMKASEPTSDLGRNIKERDIFLIEQFKQL